MAWLPVDGEEEQAAASRCKVYGLVVGCKQRGQVSAQKQSSDRDHVAVFHCIRAQTDRWPGGDCPLNSFSDGLRDLVDIMRPLVPPSATASWPGHGQPSGIALVLFLRHHLHCRRSPGS